jgi:hypothetical protein
VLTDGRPTIAMDTYVRLMVLKQRLRWRYRTLAAEVSDSIHRRVREGASNQLRRGEPTGVEELPICHAHGVSPAVHNRRPHGQIAAIHCRGAARGSRCGIRLPVSSSLQPGASPPRTWSEGCVVRKLRRHT